MSAPFRFAALRLRRLWPAVLTGAVLCVAAAEGLAAFDIAGASELSLRLEDRLLRDFRGDAPRSTTITLIGIDDLTLESVAAHEPYRLAFGRWPFARSLYARLLEELTARGARAVVLDGVLEGDSDDPAEDLLFAEALGKPGRAPFFAGVGVSALPGGATAQPPTSAVHVDTLAVVPLRRQERHDASGAVTHALPMHAVPPASSFATALAGLGLITSEADADGVMRRTRFVAQAGEHAWPTLAVAVAAAVEGPVTVSPGRITVGTRVVPLDATGTGRLDYGGALRARFDTVSLVHVLDDLSRGPDVAPRLPSALFAGRVVFIAGFAGATGDARTTPFERDTPGVAKHAAELEGLLTGGFLRALPVWWARLAMLGLALVALTLVVAGRLWAIEVATPVALFFLASGGAGLLVRTSGVLAPMLPLLATPLLASAVGVLLNRVFVSRDRELLRTTFGRYMERQLVEQLVEGKDLSTLEAHREDISVFFSDIAGFTTLSEQLRDDPERLAHFLNTYLTRVTEVLVKHGACVDKYIGDAVVALFGAPVRFEDHALRAVRAALEVQAVMAGLSAELKVEVATRIGVNTGTLLVGNFGSEQLVDYTAIGDDMNLAARLEAANKAYGTSILIGPETARRVAEQVALREVDTVRVPGREAPVVVFEPLPHPQPAVVSSYADALKAWRSGDAGRALTALRVEALATDGPARALRKRCEDTLAAGRPVEVVAALTK